jgi:hypothetical protein
MCSKRLLFSCEAAAGVEFIDENGGGAGVRLRKPSQAKPKKSDPAITARPPGEPALCLLFAWRAYAALDGEGWLRARCDDTERNGSECQAGTEPVTIDSSLKRRLAGPRWATNAFTISVETASGHYRARQPVTGPVANCVSGQACGRRVETRTHSTAFATEAGDDVSLDVTDTAAAETGCASTATAASGRHHTTASAAGSSAPA